MLAVMIHNAAAVLDYCRSTSVRVCNMLYDWHTTTVLGKSSVKDLIRESDRAGNKWRFRRVHKIPDAEVLLPYLT